MRDREGYHRRLGPGQPSEAQRQVLDLLVEGMTNAEIGESLGLSVNTVRWHIGQLLAELGLPDREALAAWWRTGRQLKSRVPPVLLWKAIPSPALVASLIGVGIAITVSAVIFFRSISEPDEPGPTVSEVGKSQDKVERIRAQLAAVPTATPDLRGQAWIVDLVQAQARPLNFFPPVVFSPSVFGFAEWVEDGSLLLGSWAGSYGLVDLSGRLRATISSPQGGLLPGTIALPLRGQASVLVWRIKTGDLALFDPTTQTDTPVASLPGTYDFSLSPDGSKLAFTRKRFDALDIVLLNLADRREIALASLAGDHAAASHLTWSPDGKALLLSSGTATYRDDGYRVSSRFDRWLVFGLDGRVLWELPVCDQLCAIRRVLWSGPGTLFIGTDGDYGPLTDDYWMDGYFLDLTANESHSVHFDGYLRCVSPSGRYAVLDQEGGSTVWDLQKKGPVLTGIAKGTGGHCAWSTDESLLVLSSGGV